MHRPIAIEQCFLNTHTMSVYLSGNDHWALKRLTRTHIKTTPDSSAVVALLRPGSIAKITKHQPKCLGLRIREKDVIRLEIAMVDAQAVAMIDRIDELQEPVPYVLIIILKPCNMGIEIPSGIVIHNKVYAVRALNGLV